MINYLLIADVKLKNQKESYFNLSKYLQNLNKKLSNIYMVKFNGMQPEYYQVDLEKHFDEAIEFNSNFEYKYDKIKTLCIDFIKENAKNDLVFILIDCCLVNSPLNNISFNTYYDQEYSYKLYEDLWKFVNNDGKEYINNTNWCCFSRGDNLLGFLSRALIKNNDDNVEERYKIKNLLWYYHNEENNKGKLDFPKELEDAIKNIR